MLPLLTVLFLFSYGLMTLLIVEQGQTIESQRVLIRELFRDSTELSAVKGKAVRDKNIADAQRRSQNPKGHASAQDPAVQTPSTQTPLTQAPSTQVAPSAQTPSTQVAPKRRSQTSAGKKPQFQVPSRPAADLADDRRALITI
jgi:hypothetical protein